MGILVKRRRPYTIVRPSFLLFHIEALLEAINTSASINQLLLAGIERMAFGTDIHFHFLFRGTRLKSFTAYAANHTLAVLGMDVFLHCCFTSFAYAMAVNRKTHININTKRLQPLFSFEKQGYSVIVKIM